MILGGGPNRIGQGIEFDYCCVQAAFALREAGYEVVMVNSNPETVSTDYDTSRPSLLRAADGRGRAQHLRSHEAGRRDRAVRRPDAAEPGEAAGSGRRADHRHQRRSHRHRPRTASASPSSSTNSGCKQPANGTAPDLQQALSQTPQDRLPGARAAELRPRRPRHGDRLHRRRARRRTCRVAVDVSPGRPVLIDKFLENATEVDVDCLSDGIRTVIGGVMQHIEEAGIHSGDSACVIPPHSLPPAVVDEIKAQTRKLAAGPEREGADEHPVRGHRRRRPDGSRRRFTSSKPTRGPAARCRSSPRRPAFRSRGSRRSSWSARRSTNSASRTRWCRSTISVKESVFPFNKFPGVDIILGPEMQSTGEVMGIDDRSADGVRQVADGRERAAADERARSSSRVADRDKDAAGADRPTASPTWATSLIATRGTATAFRMQRHPGRGCAEDCRKAGRTCSTS